MLFNVVKDFLDDTTWLPNQFKIAGYISLMSFISRRAFEFRYSLRRYYTNTYIMTLGDSGTGKGVVLDDFLKRIILDVGVEHTLLSDVVTPEKLLRLLSTNSIRTWINDELSTLITQKRYMSDLVDVLNLLYNSHLPQITVSRVKKDYVIENPTLSIAFGTQPNTLKRIATFSNITSGLIPRFMIFYGEEQTIKHVSSHMDVKEIYPIISDYYSKTVRIEEPISVELSDSNLDWFLNLVKNTKKNTSDEELLLYFARINDHIAKLILLLTVDGVLECLSGNSSYTHNIGDMSNMSIYVSNVITVTTKSIYTSNIHDNNMRGIVTDNTTDRVLIKQNLQSEHDTTQFNRHVSYFKPINLNINFSTIKLITETIIKLYTDSIIDMMDKPLTYDKVILNKHVRAIKRVISKMDIKENENGEYIVKRRDVLRQLHTTLKKLQPYEQTLKELGIIKEIRREDRKWLWVIDKKEFELYS